MKPIIFISFLKILLLLFLIPPVTAGSLTKLSTNIEGGKWKSVRLKNLPKDIVVTVRIETDGEIKVVLVDSKDDKLFSEKPQPLFQGVAQRRISFSIVTPSTGNYLIVLDNRLGKESRSIDLMVHAARVGADQIKTAGEVLRNFESQLHQIFIFESFPMGVIQCKAPKAFVDDASGIFLCKEYVHYLYEALKDLGRTKDILSFSIFYETSRLLLKKWNYPSSNDEEAIDEFTTVLMIMLNQKKKLTNIGEFLVNNPSVSESMEKIFQDEHHPLSIERVEKILNWLKDPYMFALKWQKFLIPHMQTNLLKRLSIQPTPWTDLPLVEKELLRRRGKITL